MKGIVMAKHLRCGNGHSNGATDKKEDEGKLKDGRFCPPLLKLMVKHTRGEAIPTKYRGHVADGHD